MIEKRVLQFMGTITLDQKIEKIAQAINENTPISLFYTSPKQQEVVVYKSLIPTSLTQEDYRDEPFDVLTAKTENGEEIKMSVRNLFDIRLS